MPRRMRRRRIRCEPNATYYKPAGVRLAELEEVILALDEFEAIRLSDYKKLTQEKAAALMGVSQPTFNRILSSARAKIADVLINGKAIRIKSNIVQK